MADIVYKYISSRNEYQLLNIMVEAIRPEGDEKPFGSLVGVALREYADALDGEDKRDPFGDIKSPIDSLYGDVQRFDASNGCVVKIIHGCKTIMK